MRAIQSYNTYNTPSVPGGPVRLQLTIMPRKSEIVIDWQSVAQNVLNITEAEVAGCRVVPGSLNSHVKDASKLATVWLISMEVTGFNKWDVVKVLYGYHDLLEECVDARSARLDITWP